MATLNTFPAFHVVKGRSVLVVGGGDAAAAKVRLLRETSARVVVVAEKLSEEMSTTLSEGGVLRIARAFEVMDAQDRSLVFVATGDALEDRWIARAVRGLGVPVNVVDRPDLCDFLTPALVNRAPVAVAISSEGTSPVLARHVRSRVEGALPANIGDLAALAGRLRQAVSKVIPGTVARRRFWDRLLAGAIGRQALSGNIPGAQAAALKVLNTEGANAGGGFVALVGAGPGAADLLTLRAQRALQEADVIVHDRLVSAEVLGLARREARRIAVGKAKGVHSHTQDQINDLLVGLAQAGHTVVRLKGGDPLIFGRAGEELAALRAAGIAHEIVPGVTSALAAAADVRLPLTLRGVASTLIVATGHDLDGETLPAWAGLALGGATVAVYMGKSVAATLAERLVGAGLAATTPVAVIENASRADARNFIASLATLPVLVERTDVPGPVLIMVGEAVAHADLAAFEPLTSSRVSVAA